MHRHSLVSVCQNSWDPAYGTHNPKSKSWRMRPRCEGYIHQTGSNFRQSHHVDEHVLKSEKERVDSVPKHDLISVANLRSAKFILDLCLGWFSVHGYSGTETTQKKHDDGSSKIHTVAASAKIYHQIFSDLKVPKIYLTLKTSIWTSVSRHCGWFKHPAPAGR